jgi:hypothetical protein
MTKNELTGLILEGLSDYLSERTSVKPQPIRKNTMKQSDLKSLVKEVVRQCVNEAGPQYKVLGKHTQVDQPGKTNRAREIQSDPVINELSDLAGDEASPDIGEETPQYNEQDEVRLLKAMAKAILALLKMHRGMDEPAEDGAEGDGVPFKKPEADAPKAPKSPAKSEEPKEKEVDENLQVQVRSFKTSKDSPSNPKHVRDPKVPQ